MTLRTKSRIVVLTVISVFCAAAVFSGCSQSPSGSQAEIYQDPPEMTATYDSLEALAGNTGKTLTFEDYEAVYSHFLERYPNSTALHRDWQSGMDAFDRTGEKTSHYKQLHEQNPESAMYAYLYGRCLQGEGEREMFQRAIELDPDYFWGNFGYAVIALRTSPVDTAVALRHLERALEIDRTYPGAYSQLINIHDERGELDKAVDYAKSYTKTSPDSYRPIMMHTDLLKRLNRGDEAEKLMLEFAATHEENTSVRSDLVDHFKEKENFVEALKWQYEYVEVARDPDAALVDVSKLHLSLSSPDSALHYLNQAAERGYTDFRRVTRNPELAGVRSVDGFSDLIKDLKSNAETAREQRLANFLENAEANRAETLADKLDQPAPAFAFKNLEGKSVALEDLRGKVVVIDFWATWCGPCRMTMPVLQEFVDRADKNVVFLSLNVWEDDQSMVVPYIEDYGYSFNVLYGDNQVAADYNVSGIPTMVVIDQEGILRYKHIGYDPHLDQILLWQTAHLLSQSQSTQAKI